MLVLVLDITKNKKNMLQIIKSIPPVLITLITMFGVLMHDTRMDKVSVAIALPVIAVGSAAALEKAITPNYHTHVERASLERASFRSSLPNMQPPRDDDRRYIQNKKLLFMGGSDAVGIWPSV